MVLTKEQKFWLESDFVFELLKQIPAYVFWKDKNSIYLGCNNAFAYSLGLSSPAEIIGKTDYDLPTTKETSDAFRADDRHVIESRKPKLNIEEYQTFSDGRKVALLTNKVPLLDKHNNVIGVLGIYHDITERKNREEDLRIAKEEAEAANKAKTMFLANMSHDLKTPLSGIITTAEILAQLITDLECKNFAEDIRLSGLRLLDFMVEIIEVSKLETKNISHSNTRFRLKDLINDIVVLMKPALADKPYQLEINYDENIPTYLIGDRFHLNQIILNLVSNAVKFTKAGFVRINAQQLKKSNQKSIIKIDIIDSGIGIPKDKQSIIFDQFTRLTPSYEGVYKGSGLGLYIVKQYIEAMHGEIHVESEENKGSTFTCILPLKKSLLQTENEDGSENVIEPKAASPGVKEMKKQDKPISESTFSKEVKILLIEDDPIAAKAAQWILQSLNCSVDVANTGNDALRMYDSHKYHLIYLDLGLPDISGIEVALRIREIESETKNRTPIIALSAHVNNEIKEGCLKAGMDDVFSKPLIANQALKIIQERLDISTH